MSQPVPAESNQAAMWSMILGIAAIPIGICVGKWGLAAFLLGGTAFVLGIVALARIRHAQVRQKGRAQAWLGIVLGLLMCLVGLVIALLTVVGDFFSWIAQIL
jgi:hypothetical protein